MKFLKPLLLLCVVTTVAITAEENNAEQTTVVTPQENKATQQSVSDTDYQTKLTKLEEQKIKDAKWAESRKKNTIKRKAVAKNRKRRNQEKQEVLSFFSLIFSLAAFCGIVAVNEKLKCAITPSPLS